MTSEVFGEGYAATYDHVYADKDYVAECDLLEELFATHAQRPVRSILDLGCGTGRHALELARRGYEVVGVDRAEGMLARAEAAAEARDLAVGFELGDLRDTRLDQRFDAVLMMFAVLGYQLTDDDVSAALRTVHHHLEPGGVFAFDVWYGPAVLATGPDHRERDVVVDGRVWRRTSSGEPHADAPLVDVTIRLEPPDGGTVSETHTVRHFHGADLERHLADVSLRLSALHPVEDLSAEPDATTWNVLGLARRDPAGP